MIVKNFFEDEIKKKNKIKIKKRLNYKKEKKKRKLHNYSQVLTTEEREGITIKILFSQGYTILRRMGQ
jgi:hypothetical protein